MENTSISEGQNGTLFDLDPFVVPGKVRKPYETEAEKRSKELQAIRLRDIKNIQRKANVGKTLTADEDRRLEKYYAELGQETGEGLPAGVVKTQRDVAEHFGKHIQTVKNWCKDGMPRNPDSYDLKTIEAWAIEKEFIKPADLEENREPVPVGARSGAPVANSKAHYELEVKKHQAEKLRIDNEVKLGKLVLTDEVESGRVSRIMIVKSAMLSTPRTWAPRFVGIESARESETLLKDLMLGLCARFAEG